MYAINFSWLPSPLSLNSTNHPSLWLMIYLFCFILLTLKANSQLCGRFKSAEPCTKPLWAPETISALPPFEFQGGKTADLLFVFPQHDVELILRSSKRVQEGTSKV